MMNISNADWENINTIAKVFNISVPTTVEKRKDTADHLKWEVDRNLRWIGELFQYIGVKPEVEASDNSFKNFITYQKYVQENQQKIRELFINKILTEPNVRIALFGDALSRFGSRRLLEDLTNEQIQKLFTNAKDLGVVHDELHDRIENTNLSRPDSKKYIADQLILAKWCFQDPQKFGAEVMHSWLRGMIGFIDREENRAHVDDLLPFLEFFMEKLNGSPNPDDILDKGGTPSKKVMQTLIGKWTKDKPVPEEWKEMLAQAK